MNQGLGILFPIPKNTHNTKEMHIIAVDKFHRSRFMRKI